MSTHRARHEIEHGKKLVRGDAEWTWGWGSPAGKHRAKRRGQLIIQAARIGPNSKVLEVGCGTGLFTEMFAGSGAEIVAVDISPELIQKARQRGLPADRVRFLAKSFEDCGVDGPFDAVIGSSVLHHLEVVPALTKILSLLRPGGVLAFAEPNMLNPQICVQKNIPAIKRLLGDSPDETAFVRWHLRRLLLSMGYDDTEITPIDWLHPATPRVLIGAVSQLGRLLEKLPLVQEFSGSLLIRARRSTAARARSAA